MRTTLVSLLASSVVACSVDTAGLREGSLDASARLDASLDARHPDGGTDRRDASGRDASGRDAARTDAGSPPDAAPADARTDAGASCDDTFGSALEHVPCWETETTCAFNVRTSGDSCENVCASFGRRCVEGYDNPNPPDDVCAAGEAEGCGHTGHGTELCECEL